MDYNLKDLEKWNEKIETKSVEEGLDFYPQEFEIVGFDEMLGYEAYVGMPSRYPHWSFGKSYEKNKTLYSFNLTGLPYEMVINSDPCLAYLMRENSILLQILTMAHVYGHNDFFKNNRLFKEGTNAKFTLQMFKLDGDRIREYINTPGIGYDNVERILDAAHAIKFNIPRIAGQKARSDEEIKKSILEEYHRKIENRSVLDADQKIELPNLDKVPLEPCDDVIQFIIDHGVLKEWEKDILKIVRRETEYFIPQIETKTMNEGWASFWHYTTLKELHLPQGLHFEFLKRHNDVVAPMIGGLNPYYIGFKIFQDIEKRYGREKLFEVRALERDASFIRKYLTKDLCEELNLFQYDKRSFDYVIEEVSDEFGWKEIRDNLSFTSGIGSIPYIRVIDLNSKNNVLTLEHVFDGREFEIVYAKETLKYLQRLWQYPVRLITKTKEGKEFYIDCDDQGKVLVKESSKR